MISEYKIVNKVLEVSLTIESGIKNLKMGGYTIQHNQINKEHGIIYRGNIQNPGKPVLLRLNSACYTSDVFGCQRCDCNWQLLRAMEMISQEQDGLIIYHFDHEGRGAGWTNKLKTYSLMEKTKCTSFEAFVSLGIQPDLRDYSSAIVILKDLNIKSVNLITNNLEKEEFLISHGIAINLKVPLVNSRKEWQSYLISKKQQFGHKINDEYF
jgi:GTP cyclohydrolase II